MNGYRDDKGIRPTRLEIAAVKSLFGVALAAIVLLAWAVGLIEL